MISMGTGRRYLLVSVMAGIFFLAFGSADNAYATTTTLDVANTGMACESLGGVWNTPPPTCTFSITLGIAVGDTLTVTNGVILAFDANDNLVNQGKITNFGTITTTGTTINNGVLSNRNTAEFTNFGKITITATSGSSGQLRNLDSADFTNSGIITIIGTSERSGQLRNENTADFTNSGTITITGTSGESGQLRNLDSAEFKNSGIITITGTSGNSGQLRNEGAGFIFNDCGEITFESITGNPIQETPICEFGKSNAYEDATIGKSHSGKQVVKNGICIDIKCWTVTAHYHQDFNLVKMLSDSTHTISTTVFCQHGVSKCNYVAFGVSPYGTNINDSVWKIILQKDHRDKWTMKVIDPDGYLGEVTSLTQIVNDRYLSASVTIEFKKPTPGMILNIEVRDSGGGYRDFKFNDGIAIADAYAYPLIETFYEQPLEIEPLCLNENPNKRYTCAFDKVRDWTIKKAKATLEQILK